MPAQADVSADAALILAALGRMEAVVRDERAAFARLRVMLGDMAQAIARGKAVANSETAATLLDELEHRVDAMIDIAGPGPTAEAAAVPDPQPPSSAPGARDDAPLAHGTAPDAGAAAQAVQRPAEYDQVPTVSDVVSRFSSDDEPQPVAEMPVDDTASSPPTVAMLTAMVEALRDSISAAAPEAEAALESPTPQAAEVVAQPLDVAPQLAMAWIEIAEDATPTAEIAEAAETAHAIEAPQAEEATQAAAATHSIEVAEAADIPPPADAAPDNSGFVAMLRARLDALNAAAAAAALESEAPVAEVGAQPSDLVPQPETSSIEIAEAATPTEAAETAHAIEAPQTEEAPQAIAATPIEVAEAADISPPADAAPDNSAFVAMLRARLDALNAAAAAAALESEAPLAEAAAQPLDLAPQDLAPQDLAPQDLAPQDLAPQNLAPQPETSSIESAELPTPTAEIVQAVEAAHITEAPQAEATPASEAIHTADVAEAPPIPGPAVTDLHESALLASLEQMGVRPFPPPDEGTAVIFAPKPESEFLPEFARGPMALSETPEPGHVAVSQPATEPAAIEHTVLAPTAAESQPEPPHAVEPSPPPAETTMAEIIADLTRDLAPEPALPAALEAAADVEPAIPIEATTEPAPSEMAAPTTADSDFDPADFLFGPEPEPDPAAFLLDPAPPPAKPAAENPDALPPAEPDPPAQTAPEPAPRDPLRALKAMSENEKLALFS